MNRAHLVLPLVLSLLPAACVRARAPHPSSLPPIREVALTVEATVSGIPADAKELKLWIPVPRDEGAQSLLRVVPDSAPGGTVVSDSKGNPSLLVVVKSPASTATARATFEVSRSEQRGAGTPHPLAHAEKTKNPETWLADEGIPPVDDRIRSIAAEVFAGATTHAEKAKAAWTYVLRDMRDDPHSLFVALLRAGGVPARCRAGFSLPADSVEGTIAEPHAWAEWWNPGNGWTPVDATAASRNAERREFLFGNLDHDRVGISLGHGLVYDGQKGPARNESVLPYAELDGAPVKVATTVSFKAR